MNILIATDNHLGFAEKDPIRGQDSFVTFEEILSHAKERHVDMILLSGDLFHENRPSRDTLHQCMSLLRKYCLGERPSQLILHSDPRDNFDGDSPQVNYLDPNHNISIPIFSIHGNHDDPSGGNNLCSMDLLSVAGLVNYFGKVKDVDNIQLSPILLSKGATKLALYGLGSIRDERLYRSFQRKKVSLLRPPENQQEWFNILLFHQNRAAHSPTNYIPEQFIDDFINLIIWGHEHECLIDPQLNPQQQFHVCQPGSSVATSLSEGEAKQKFIGLLSIIGKEYRLEKIPLRTVRPFLLKEISLSDYKHLCPMDLKEINRFLVEQVEGMLSRSHDKLPLVRLKVDYSGGYLTINPQRFGQQFVDKVANPKDIVLFHRKRVFHNGERRARRDDIMNDDEAGYTVQPEEDIDVEQLVSDFLTNQSLVFLPENEFTDAVQKYVEKDDKDAIDKFIQQSLTRVRSRLALVCPSDDVAIMDEIFKEKQSREEVWHRHQKATELSLDGDENISRLNQPAISGSKVSMKVLVQASEEGDALPSPSKGQKILGHKINSTKRGGSGSGEEGEDEPASNCAIGSNSAKVAKGQSKTDCRTKGRGTRGRNRGRSAGRLSLALYSASDSQHYKDEEEAAFLPPTPPPPKSRSRPTNRMMDMHGLQGAKFEG